MQLWYFWHWCSPFVILSRRFPEKPAKTILAHLFRNYYSSPGGTPSVISLPLTVGNDKFTRSYEAFRSIDSIVKYLHNHVLFEDKLVGWLWQIRDIYLQALFGRHLESATVLFKIRGRPEFINIRNEKLGRSFTSSSDISFPPNFTVNRALFRDVTIILTL